MQRTNALRSVFWLTLTVGLAGCGGGGTSSSQLTISATSPPPPPGETGVAYPAFTFVAPTGGVGPYTWSETGALPQGMSLSSDGRLSGTPTTAGTFSFTVTVTDSSSPNSSKESVTLLIRDSPLMIRTTPMLPFGSAVQPYPGFAFTASGGSAPITWQVTAGVLPAGMTLGTDGTLFGTPSAGGSFTFTVTARDSFLTPEADSHAFTVVIIGQGLGQLCGPQSIAVDPTGRFAYVASAGCGGSYPDVLPTNGKVSMYTIDPNTGTLTFTGTVADDFCPHAVTVDPSGKLAYVANYGGGYCYTAGGVFTNGNVSMYTINPSTGALTSIGPPVEALTCTNSIAVAPFGTFVYATSSACGDDIGGVLTYRISATTGALTLMGTTGVGAAPISVAVHPSGKFAYVLNGNAGFTSGYPNESVSMFITDATTGALASIGTIAAGLGPTAIAVHPSGKFAYVPDGTGILVYTVDAATGALASAGTTPEAGAAIAIAVHPSGNFAYGLTGPKNVSMFTVNTDTGTLTSIGTIAAGLGPTAIAVHPSGKFAYVTNSASNSVSMYSIDSATGALKLIGSTGT